MALLWDFDRKVSVPGEGDEEFDASFDLFLGDVVRLDWISVDGKRVTRDLAILKYGRPFVDRITADAQAWFDGVGVEVYEEYCLGAQADQAYDSAQAYDEAA